MSYLVRSYRSEDEGLICGWWEEHGHEVPLPVHLLPKDGFMVECDGVPQGVLFLYLTVSSPVAFIEWGVSKPGMLLREMRPAFDALVGVAKEHALAAGASMVWANTLPGIARLLRKHGFSYRGRRAAMCFEANGGAAL